MRKSEHHAIPVDNEDEMELEVTPAAMELNILDNQLASDECSPDEVETSSDGGEVDAEDARHAWIKRLDLPLFFVVSVCYFVYRSQGSPTFTLTPFEVKFNDAWGILFFFAFVMTKRRSYLVYAINPLRNVVMWAFQMVDKWFLTETILAEFHRDTISAFFQLVCAVAIAYELNARPISLKVCIESIKPIQQFSSWLFHDRVRIVVAAGLVIQALVCIVWGIVNHFSNGWQGIICWKILLALLLGTAEEVTWREAFMDDTSFCIQAFVWGMNHLVVGEGMSNPWLYGLVAFLYAAVLGVCKYRVLRYASHFAIEFMIMDNLINDST